MWALLREVCLSREQNAPITFTTATQGLRRSE